MNSSKEDLLKKIVRLRFLVTSGCLLAGCLAGVNVERYLVHVPAWRNVDIASWADYTRHAYFNNGFLLFQSEAAGSFILLLVSSVIVARNKFRSVAWPLYTATLLAFAGIILTFFAAPVLLNMPASNDDTALLHQTFNNYHYWGSFRAIFQVASFFVCVVAMGRVFVIKYIKP